MFVVLAYPVDGHAPDSTLEVDERRGRQLISDGFARPVDPIEAELSADPSGEPAGASLTGDPVDPNPAGALRPNLED